MVLPTKVLEKGIYTNKCIDSDIINRNKFDSKAGTTARAIETEWPSCFVRRCVVLLHSIVCYN